MLRKRVSFCAVPQRDVGAAGLGFPPLLPQCRLASVRPLLPFSAWAQGAERRGVGSSTPIMSPSCSPRQKDLPQHRTRSQDHSVSHQDAFSLDKPAIDSFVAVACRLASSHWQAFESLFHLSTIHPRVNLSPLAGRLCVCSLLKLAQRGQLLTNPCTCLEPFSRSPFRTARYSHRELSV